MRNFVHLLCPELSRVLKGECLPILPVHWMFCVLSNQNQCTFWFHLNVGQCELAHSQTFHLFAVLLCSWGKHIWTKFHCTGRVNSFSQFVLTCSTFQQAFWGFRELNVSEHHWCSFGCECKVCSGELNVEQCTKEICVHAVKCVRLQSLTNWNHSIWENKKWTTKTKVFIVNIKYCRSLIALDLLETYFLLANHPF